MSLTAKEGETFDLLGQDQKSGPGALIIKQAGVCVCVLVFSVLQVSH